MLNPEYIREYLNYLTYISTCRSLSDWSGMFAVETKKKIKQVFSNTHNHLDRSSKAAILEIKKNMPMADHEYLDAYIDNIGPAAMEVIREYHLSEDKKEFLTMCKTYNKGLMRIEP